MRFVYIKTCVKKATLKKTKNGFQDQLLLNGGQKYCRFLQEEHSAILLTFIKLPFVIIICISVLSVFLVVVVQCTQVYYTSYAHEYFCDIVFCYYLAFLCFYIKNFVNYHNGKI